MKTNDVSNDLEKHRHELRREFSKKAIQEKILTADAKGDIDQIGLIPPAASQTERKKAEEKKQKQNASVFQQILFSIQQTKIWLTEQMERLQGELRKLSKRLNEIDRGIGSLKDALEGYRRSGTIENILELNENNDWFKEQVKEWEEQKDREFDPYSQSVEMDVREIMQAKIKEKEQLELAIKETDRELDHINSLFENLEEIEQQVQTGRISIADAEQVLSLIKPEDDKSKNITNASHLGLPLP